MFSSLNEGDLNSNSPRDLAYSLYKICKTNIIIIIVRTQFNLNPKREWIQVHVAQTMNL